MHDSLHSTYAKPPTASRKYEVGGIKYTSVIIPLCAVVLGLKASERDLEKMKCSKCDFQAFYIQQFQEHMNTEHGNDDDIQKCKCCTFLTFDSDDLLKHFKVSYHSLIQHVYTHI